MTGTHLDAIVSGGDATVKARFESDQGRAGRRRAWSMDGRTATRLRATASSASGGERGRVCTARVQWGMERRGVGGGGVGGVFSCQWCCARSHAS